MSHGASKSEETLSVPTFKRHMDGSRADSDQAEKRFLGYISNLIFSTSVKVIKTTRKITSETLNRSRNMALPAGHDCTGRQI